MHIISVQGGFSSAHALRAYKGKCENLHGHNWKIKVSIASKQLDGIGMLVDFTILRRWLSEITSLLDHKHLNEVPPFDKINPTAENLSEYIFTQMQAKMKKIRNANVHSAEVWESEGSCALYTK